MCSPKKKGSLKKTTKRFKSWTSTDERCIYIATDLYKLTGEEKWEKRWM